ncbi:MAG: tRNA lysidine(34) synthetase TilS [Microcystaceae cyanobacterium]
MTWTALHSHVHQRLKRYRYLPPESAILMAVSGGQDSVCLGQILLDLRKKWHWQLAIAHCDHGWPTDAGIADHVRALAHHWQLPYWQKTAVNLPETEEAAREWRYQALIEIAQEQHYAYIVTGHTQSDRAETFLYNLIRGAGTQGLTALTWQRFLTPTIQLVRPLLNLSRQTTGNFCHQYSLPIWEDVVNEKLTYARNRLRHRVFPYLTDHFNPHTEQHLAQTAEILQAENAYLTEITAQALTNSLGPHPHQLSLSALQTLPLALQRRVIRQFLQGYLNQTLTFEQTEEVVTLIHAPNQSCSSSLPGNYQVKIEKPWLVLLQPCPNSSGRTVNNSLKFVN